MVSVPLSGKIITWAFKAIYKHTMMCFVIVVVFSENFALPSVFSGFSALTSVCFHLYIYKVLAALPLP